MKAKAALYGIDKRHIDVTKRVAQQFEGKRHVAFYVSNGLFGTDPAPGRKKLLTVEYEDDAGVAQKLSVDENTMLFLPTSKSSSLGIFYTNNDLEPWVLSNSIQQLRKAENVDIFTCPWTPIPDNPFVERLFLYRQSHHLSVCLQILTLLSFARAVKRYDRVFFLEHDVLYPHDYFDMPDLPAPLTVNDRYIGMNANGYQLTKDDHEPLHQMVMDHDFALKHFHTALDGFLRGDGCNLEPDVKRVRRHTTNPAIHVNHGRHLTSHFATYRNETVPEIPYWGPAARWWGRDAFSSTTTTTTTRTTP